MESLFQAFDSWQHGNVKGKIVSIMINYPFCLNERKESGVFHKGIICHPDNDGMVKRFALGALQVRPNVSLLSCPLHKNLLCTWYANWTTYSAMTPEDGALCNNVSFFSPKNKYYKSCILTSGIASACNPIFMQTQIFNNGCYQGGHCNDFWWLYAFS